MKARGNIFGPIPRILHQTWKTREIPEQWRSYRDSWLTRHPSWEYRLWTDIDNRRLIGEHHPWFLPTYDSFPRNIQRVDAAKYFILYSCGGVYADLDCECLKPVDLLIEQGGVVVGKTPDRVIDGAFLASSPSHPFWEGVFRDMQSPPWFVRVLQNAPGFSASHVLLTTGPQMLRRAVGSYVAHCSSVDAAAITIYSPKAFSSRSWLRRHEPFADTDTFVHHHHSDSWLSASELAVLGLFTIRKAYAAVAMMLLLALTTWFLKR